MTRAGRCLLAGKQGPRASAAIAKAERAQEPHADSGWAAQGGTGVWHGPAPLLPAPAAQSWAPLAAPHGPQGSQEPRSAPAAEPSPCGAAAGPRGPALPRHMTPGCPEAPPRPALPPTRWCPGRGGLPTGSRGTKVATASPPPMRPSCWLARG